MTRTPPLKSPLVAEPLLYPHEVAALFRVTTNAVWRWANAGILHPVRTLGNQRRYRESEVQALLDGNAADLNQATEGI
jgi:predicted site-specific integrase-resolvase